MQIELTVNDTTVELTVEPERSLLDVLRDRLRLTGAKEACNLGECGACTVLVGGRPVLACLTLAARVHRPVQTIESIAAETADLRRRVADTGSVQCGYCTPGQIVTIAGSGLAAGGSGRHAVARALSGNLCRCSGSVGLVDLFADPGPSTP